MFYIIDNVVDIFCLDPVIHFYLLFATVYSTKGNTIISSSLFQRFCSYIILLYSCPFILVIVNYTDI